MYSWGSFFFSLSLSPVFWYNAAAITRTCQTLPQPVCFPLAGGQRGARSQWSEAIPKSPDAKTPPLQMGSRLRTQISGRPCAQTFGTLHLNMLVCLYNNNSEDFFRSLCTPCFVHPFQLSGSDLVPYKKELVDWLKWFLDTAFTWP